MMISRSAPGDASLLAMAGNPVGASRAVWALLASARTSAPRTMPKRARSSPRAMRIISRSHLASSGCNHRPRPGMRGTLVTLNQQDRGKVARSAPGSAQRGSRSATPSTIRIDRVRVRAASQNRGIGAPNASRGKIVTVGMRSFVAIVILLLRQKKPSACEGLSSRRSSCMCRIG